MQLISPGNMNTARAPNTIFNHAYKRSSPKKMERSALQRPQGMPIRPSAQVPGSPPRDMSTAWSLGLGLGLSHTHGVNARQVSRAFLHEEKPSPAITTRLLRLQSNFVHHAAAMQRQNEKHGVPCFGLCCPVLMLLRSTRIRNSTRL